MTHSDEESLLFPMNLKQRFQYEAHQTMHLSVRIAMGLKFTLQYSIGPFYLEYTLLSAGTIITVGQRTNVSCHTGQLLSSLTKMTTLMQQLLVL